MIDMAQIAVNSKGHSRELCCTYPPNFELFAKTEVLGAGQVLRARGQPLDSVLYLDSGRVAFGVCEDDQKKKMRRTVLFGGRPRVVGCSVCTGTNARADGHRQ